MRGEGLEKGKRKSGGGSAFPCADVFSPDGMEYIQGENGMTLRDYFAAKALQSIIMVTGLNKFGATDLIDARNAYHYADAMLAARDLLENNETPAENK